ncbi:TetR/AcrR family transcriptional regulator [Mesorhizobium sp. VNQ89]|uniref:TetR/AcrR family transcriptional regulator n=1 Tax=Mesorhizobium quangtriensis TaxID=3157709 RepID=UPI0032B7AEBB
MAQKFRAARSDEERQARLQSILSAALDAFAEKGLGASRLEDIATRAGIAKGTIYLYFPSKQAVFEELIRTSIVLPVDSLRTELLAQDLSAQTVFGLLSHWVRNEFLGTDREVIARLILSEVGRFPEIAAFCHRELVHPVMEFLKQIAQRACERGEFGSDVLVRFPQLAVASVLVAITWNDLFQNVEPLDLGAMIESHLDLLQRAMRSDI